MHGRDQGGAENGSQGYGLALALLAAAGLAPLLWHLGSALPQADDFCLAELWRREGFLGGYRELRATWTGRLPLALSMMAPAALAAEGLELVDAYRLVLCVQALLLALALLWMARLLLPAGRMRWLFALLLLFVLAANARTARDLLYWLGASGTYLPAGLGLGLCLLLLRRGRGLAAAALALLAGVSAEFGGPGAVLVALAVWAAERRGGRAALLVALAGLAGLAFLLLAPGNALRAAAAAPGEPLRALLESLPLALQFLAMSQTSPGFLGIGLLAAVAGARGWVAPPTGRLWPLALLALALPALAFAMGLAGAGLVLPARAQVALQIALLPPLLLLACGLGARWRAGFPQRRAALALALALLAASPNAWVASLQLGAAHDYAGAGEARLAALAAAGGGERRVAPLPAYPSLLHQEDLGSEPAYWINRCLAGYHGLTAVALKGGAPAGVQPYWFLWPFAER